MLETDAHPTDVIAMNLTITAMEAWLKGTTAEKSGEELGREIGALYREIHSAVDEMHPEEEDDDDLDDDEEDEDEDLTHE